MRFSMLLFVLMIMIKRGAKKYPPLKEKIKEKNFSILIKTTNGRRGRCFTFSNGTVGSGTGDRSKAGSLHQKKYRLQILGFGAKNTGGMIAWLRMLSDYGSLPIRVCKGAEDHHLEEFHADKA